MFKNAVRLISTGLRIFQAPCVLSRVVKHDAFSRVGESMRTFANQSTMNFQCKPKVQMVGAREEPWSSSPGPPLAINGFGRIGQMVLRLGLQAKINVVAINDPGAKIEDIAQSLKYDKVHGTFPGNVIVKGSNCLDIDGKTVRVYTEKDPEKIKWKELQVEYVIDSTGKFTEVENAKKHMAAGVKKVIISTPSQDVPMFVRGVNFDKYKKDMNVVSCAPSTTYSAAPLLNIINQQFRMKHCFLISVQSSNYSQPVPDGANLEKVLDMLENISFKWTGDEKDLGIVIPELQRKVTSFGMRMPVNVMPKSILVINVKKSVKLKKFAEKLSESYATACMKHKLLEFNNDNNFVAFDLIEAFVFDKIIIMAVWYPDDMECLKRPLDLYTHMIKVDNDSSIQWTA